jgi:hypothetical protein
MIFHYPGSVRQRRHGPAGYQDYGSYKPWLRDEFEFRCAYCLCRERWSPSGDDSFSVDHRTPRSKAPEGLCRYDNLVYACCECNSAKSDALGVPDPCDEPYDSHLEVGADGTVHPRTTEGLFLIRACRLDRSKLTEFRRGILALFETLLRRKDEPAAELRRTFFGFPLNLPDLAALKPAENARPEGVQNSHFARKRRGELPETY